MPRSFARTAAAALALALPFTLAACFDDDDDDDAPPVMTPAPTPAPTPTPTALSVQRCLDQTVAPGKSVASLVVPDVISINTASAAGFPNGRLPLDPVIDVTLAVLFLDLTRHPATTFAAIPLNPRADRPVPSAFPWLASANGNPPLSPAGTGAYNFRTDAASAYVRTDRMGMPAVATALIRSPQKVPYNDANPSNDAAGQFVPEITAQLTALHAALDDDLGRLSLSRCSTGG